MDPINDDDGCCSSGTAEGLKDAYSFCRDKYMGYGSGPWDEFLMEIVYFIYTNFIKTSSHVP